jgi:flagellar assembly protein FliH
MAAISKFLFDTDFDAGGDPLAARPASPRADTRRYTGAEVEAAKASAHAEGVAAGRAMAEQEIGRKIAEVLSAVGTQLGAVMAEAAKTHESRTREAVTAASEIVRKLLPALGKREAMAEIEALITDCLARLHDEPRLVVRVSDELLDEVRQRIDQLSGAAAFSGRVILLADNALKPGDARIEWADGGADRDTGALWREIEGAIQRFVEGGSGAPDADRK